MGSTSVLIADVDCTAGGKDLCNEIGVRGYPTIKSGDPSDLQDYKGGRSFDDLKKRAETLGPTCGPAHLDLCDEDKKKAIAEYVALGAEKRQGDRGASTVLPVSPCWIRLAAATHDLV